MPSYLSLLLLNYVFFPRPITIKGNNLVLMSFWTVANPSHIYLTQSVKYSVCKGFEIITIFTLTEVVIFFFFQYLIPKKFFCRDGVFAHMLTNACMCKERKLSFYLGPLFIGCFCLAPPSFLRQSLCEPGAHYSILDSRCIPRTCLSSLPQKWGYRTMPSHPDFIRLLRNQFAQQLPYLLNYSSNPSKKFFKL